MVSQQNVIAVKKYPYGTSTLLLVNIVYYFFICFQENHSLSNIITGPGYTALVRYGGKENGLIALGEIYRLILPMFMHANLVHLLVNMLSLWIVGRIFELIAGWKNLFIIYFIAGITGNLCSFTLIPALSVGASGSLFGILLCLYVIQKYEEKLAKELSRSNTGMQLGSVILINIIINIIAGFSFPIFDWACHLGGAVAGILFGLALTRKHRANLNAIFTLPTQRKKGLKSIFEYYKIYYFILLVVNILFALSYFNVKNYQKVFGIAIEKAAENKTQPLSYNDLLQYKDILLYQNKETNPGNMLSGAIRLQNNELFLPANKMYETLIALNREKFGSKKFLSPQTQNALETAYHLSLKGMPLPASFLSYVNLTDDENSEEDICTKPAALFMTLGFYQISGKLYECAYILNGNNERYAVNAVESFYLANDEKGLNQVLSFVNMFDNK